MPLYLSCKGDKASVRRQPQQRTTYSLLADELLLRVGSEHHFLVLRVAHAAANSHRLASGKKLKECARAITTLEIEPEVAFLWGMCHGRLCIYLLGVKDESRLLFTAEAGFDDSGTLLGSTLA
jgi:hypothetical protein